MIKINKSRYEKAFVQAIIIYSLWFKITIVWQTDLDL